jgi:hypothetical protein
MFGQRKPMMGGNPFTMSPENSAPMYAPQAGAPAMTHGNPYLMGGERNMTIPQGGGMIDPRMVEQPKPKGGGIFGRQSALWKVLGTLGDGLTGNPAYGQSQMQERHSLMQQEQQRQRAEAEQRQRMDDRAYERQEWDRRRQVEINNPKPQNPHYWETNDGSLASIGPDGKPQVLYKDPTPKVSYQRVENGDGTFTMVPVVNGQIMAGGGQQQAMPAPGTVMADPRLNGGSAPQAQGGFR